MTLAQGDRIGLVTSGGDAPGMNAALRGAARVALELGFEPVGIEEGYEGLLSGAVVPLDLRALDDASRRGGTMLGTARSKTFPTPEGQARARVVIENQRLAGLVIIGGNGSLTGARSLVGANTASGRPLVVAGVPASIDNDLAYSSMSIGVDTAMNTIVEACDRILDTAAAHRRTFLVEVMGRDSGYLAMTAGVAAGADAVIVREMGKDEDGIVEHVVRTMRRAYVGNAHKRRVLVLKAENVDLDIARLKERVDARIKGELKDVDTRVTVLGHVVRGGTPTAFDRLLGARLANAAIRGLAAGQTDFMAGWLGPGVPGTPTAFDPYVVLSPLEEVLRETERMMRGESALAAWRKKIYQEVESILNR
ncbi:MAG: 6-phosphofructokinase [Myxococcales bacterium]|nr:6-phosphofructokinase [Myxococcales bacterium]